MILLSILVGLTSIATAIALLALVDQYRTLEIIREELGLSDQPEPLGRPSPCPLPSDLGLPAKLDGKEYFLLLFLSTSCSTCKAIAKRLDGAMPENLQIVLETPSHGDPVKWLSEVDLADKGVVVDSDSHIADMLELDVTPAVFVYQRGDVVMSQTVPSYRQLEPLIRSDRPLVTRD